MKYVLSSILLIFTSDISSQRNTFWSFLPAPQGGGVVCDTDIEGYGSQVTGGGASPTVLTVTNLHFNKTSPVTGSLPWALAQCNTGNHKIVFSVGGVIDSVRWVTSEDGALVNVTIDGSTAPSPGITFDNKRSNGTTNGNTFSFEGSGSNNVIIKSITLINAGNDCLNIVDAAFDIVVDHCALYGASDGNLDVTTGSNHVTVQWCIIGGGGIAGWSGCSLVAYSPTKQVTFHHNLFSSLTNFGAQSVGERIPLVHYSGDAEPAYEVVDFRNNLIWRWGRENGTGSGYGTGIGYNATANIVNNYYYGGDVDYDQDAIDLGIDGTNGYAYITGNVSGDGLTSTINGYSNRSQYTISNPYQVTMQDACSAAALILQCAGPTFKDATTQGYIDAVTSPGCHHFEHRPKPWLYEYPYQKEIYSKHNFEKNINHSFPLQAAREGLEIKNLFT